VLDRSVRRDVSGPEVASVLARAARESGLSRFVDMDALTNLQHRIAFARANGFAIAALDDAAIDAAFVAIAEGARSFADLRNASLLEAIRAHLGHDVLARLERFAPDHVGIAGRPRVELTYAADRPPNIESRMQDFFGTADGPRICDGRVPVVLHLLAPNQRAVQVTTDLAGFWERHYPAIRKELMRKYPRHFWPEDPRTAEPRKPTPRRPR
jgi:ATP-dependent helicase HrpB